MVPSPPARHPAAGQGSLEYVGLLAVVAAVLVAAGPAAGVSGVGPQVAKVVKTGVCIVAGDVCRASDAAAAGLAPCMLAERRRGGAMAVILFSIRVASGDELVVERRSDGTFLIVHNTDDGAGVAGGLGFTVGPVRAGIDATAGLTVARATAWELPDEASVRRFLAEPLVRHELGASRWRPAWRSGGLGLATSGWAGLGVQLGGDDSLGGSLIGAEAAAESAAGVRIGRGTTTYFIRAESSGPQLADAFGHTLGGGRSRGPVVAEYTRDAHGPRELAFRIVTAGARSGESVETVARLDLRDPASRAVAGRLLRLRAPWTGAAAGELRDAIRRATATGTVERSVYAVEDHSVDLALAGRLGVAMGVEGGRTNVSRTLVEASAWTPGSGERAREDCLG